MAEHEQALDRPTMSRPPVRWLLAVICGLFAPLLADAAWKHESSTDAFTDESIHIASTAYVQGVNTHAFYVRCKDNRFEAYASFDEFLDNDSVDVRYRVDKNPAVSESWFPSSSGTSVFASDDARIAREIIAGSTLLIEARDYRGVAHRMSFDLTGSRAAIEPVMRACGIAMESLDSKVAGLRADVASELENWGPRQISTGKEILIDLGKFDGPVSPEMTGEFALALQAVNDGYIEDCKAGRASGVSCDTMKVFWDADMEPVAMPISLIVHEVARGDAGERFGKLRMGE